MAYIDKHRVGQVITNFVTNAIKHTTSGHIKVGYSYKNEVMEVYVEDTGRGIAKDKQQLVSQRFQKLDNITQGTRLGLSIVAALMQRFGGKCGFESEEGVGSRFWACAKLKMTIVDESEKEKHLEGSEDITVGISHSNLNILIAEDIHSNYLLIKKILVGQNITHVENGKDAINSVREGKFDLVLMDMSMPLMGGLEATRQIRKFNMDIPIIAVTANAFGEDRVVAMEAGSDAFLTKPLLKEDVLGTIDLLCR